MLLVVALQPLRSHAQEPSTVGREIAFIYNTIEQADYELLPAGNACDMSEAMELLVESITSNEYAGVPMPLNIKEFFSGIPEEIIAYPLWYAGEEDSLRQLSIAEYYDAIEAFDDYVEGRTGEFPIEPLMQQVSRALVAYDDAIYEGLCLSAPYRLLAYRLLQQMVLHAPSIDMVATSVNSSRRCAVLDMYPKTYYERPQLCPIFIYDDSLELWRVIMLKELAPRTATEIERLDF